MEQHPVVEPEAGKPAPLPFAADGAAHAFRLRNEAPTSAPPAKRPFPFVGVGVALGSGLLLGALGYRLLAPRPRPTLLERLGLASVAAAAARGLTKLF